MCGDSILEHFLIKVKIIKRKGEKNIVVYNNVIEYCSKHNLSIFAFEQKCGIGNGTVAKWREKNYEPSIPTLQKIVNATNVPITEWLKE